MAISPRDRMNPTGAPSALPGALQPKLVIGPANDPLEREADAIADRVLRPADTVPGASPSPLGLRRACAACEEEERLSRAPGDGCGSGVAGARAPAIVGEVLRSPGESLDGATRAFFEPRLGHDLSAVRIHRDGAAAASARSVAARAYTVGNHVVFSGGQFRPETDAGRRLLGHELVHTIQQGAASRLSSPAPAVAASGLAARPTVQPRVQRALSCALDAVHNECSMAASKCAGIQKSYCQVKYPKRPDIDNLHHNAVKAANTYKSKYPNAAANLLHYLDGTGTEQVMPVNIFKTNSATKDKLENEHRDKFIEGGKRRLKSGVLKPGGGPVDMVWTGTANAFHFGHFTDLGIAVGGYTLCSKVQVSAAAKSGGVTMTFDKWVVQAFDCYNWDPGKGIGVPGADDNDLCCLENAKRAQHFLVRTDPWKNDDAAARAPADLGSASSSSHGHSSGGGSKR